jgi:hypothetical protein
MAGKTISLVKGLPESLEKSANEEKATAKGVNDQRKLEEAERYPACESAVSDARGTSIEKLRSTNPSS